MKPLRFAVIAPLAAAACGGVSGSVKNSSVASNGVDATDDRLDYREAGTDWSSVDANSSGPQDEAGAQDSSGTDMHDSGTDVRPNADANMTGNPINIASSHLRLWLAADFGITCSLDRGPDGSMLARVASWSDQSGHHNDAALQQMPPQLGPQCHVPGHAVNGLDLPYFSAPNNGNAVDETLDVDMGFLKGSDYTVFVVERRWADLVSNPVSEFVVGTTMPAAVESAALSQWCNPRPANEVFAIGYSYYTGGPQLLLSQGCGPLGGNAPAVPTPPPSPLTEETGRLDLTAGRELWIKGSPFAADTNSAPLSYAAGGAVGRAANVTTANGFDGRFRGDIAEIVVYDAALSSADRIAVETYLQAHWRY